MDNEQYKNIYLIRHPKTEAPVGVCYGNSDILPEKKALNEATEKVLSKIRTITPDACYSSPLKRCSMLAKKLVGEEKVQTDELLREIDFASWEMTPWDKIPQEQQEQWGKDYINCKIHGGENFYDVQNRVIQFWEKLTPTINKEILIVTHAGLIRAILAYLLEASPYKIFAIEADYGDVIQIKWTNANYYKLSFL